VWSSYILDNSLLSTDDTAVVERMLCKVDICVCIPVLDLFDGLLKMGAHGLARARRYTMHGEIVEEALWRCEWKRDDLISCLTAQICQHIYIVIYRPKYAKSTCFATLNPSNDSMYAVNSGRRGDRRSSERTKKGRAVVPLILISADAA